MRANNSRKAAVVGLAALMALGSLGLLGGMGLVSAVHAGTSGAASAAPTASAPAAASPRVSTAVVPTGATGSNIAETMANNALAATAAAGLKPNVAFLPRPSASSAQVAQAKQTGTVTPLYSGSPAPMGLAYYGLSAGAGGAVVPTILNTTSLIADVNFNATGVQANDLFQSSPDSYGIQLNAVTTNVTLFGTGGYSFWTQNVIEYYPATHVMFLITNVWNFSGGPLSANVFYQHGPYGTQVGTTYYFAEVLVPFPVYYPFDLTLWENSTITDGRNAVDFNVGVSSAAYPSEDFVAPYDYVIFNSLATGGTPLTTPSNYTANGEQYNPIGLTDDYELIFGGPGGGSQSTLFAADATLGLGYWDGTGYTSVPAAYSYGGETGETVTGANIAWSNAPAGEPSAGLATYGTMTTGPAVLTGLWNATAPEGSYAVTLDVTPANAFNVLATAGGWSSNFTISELAVAPELNTNTLNLIPGDYTLVTELANYAPVTTALDVTANTTVTITLASAPAFGVYTPLWAFSNAQLAAISTGGTGTATNPYTIVNDQYGVIGSAFGLYNDYAFPVYPGVFFYGTSASVQFDHPPSFATATNTFQFPGPYLPTTNDLQYWFWNVSNVSIVNAANISGWFGATAFYPAVFDTFSVIFYEGGHNLIAADTFFSEGQGLLLFSGGTFFGALNVGGGNNTVWGNSFFEVATPPSVIQLLPAAYGLAMEIAESNDLIYNNYVATPTTAWLLPINLYSGYPEFFTDAFNIAKAPASAVNYAAGFPLEPLTGSIIHTTYQGGNYWWDYGLATNPYNGASNPYGLLPYEERAPTLLVDVYGPAYYYATYIYPGGDYVPLIPHAVYAVTISDSGLPTGLVWGATITNGAGTVLDDAPTTATGYTVYLPNGTFSFAPIAPAGWSSSNGRVTVAAGHAPPVVIDYTIARGYHTLTFKESGLARGVTWGVTINGTTLTTYALNATESTTGTSLVFAVVKGGTFDYAVTPTAGYTVSPSSGIAPVSNGNVVVHLRYTLVTYTVTFTATGLPAGKSWRVIIGSKSISSRGPSIVFQLPNGTYTYTIVAPAGYTATPSSGPLTVAGAGLSEPVVIAKA